MDINLTPIGHVRGGRDQPIDDDWGHSRASLVLDPGQFEPDALAGLADFSHAEVIFHFDKVSPDKIIAGARRPRGREDWPLVGIFAQRGKNRPQSDRFDDLPIDRRAGPGAHGCRPGGD